MKPLRHRFLTAPLAALMLCASGSSSGADVSIRPIEEYRMRTGSLARVLASFDVHASAARRWYVDALHGRHVDRADFDSFSQPLLTDRIVSFTYRFVQDGKPQLRAYHARSGSNHPWSRLPASKRAAPYITYFPRHGADTVAWSRERLAIGKEPERKVARQIDRDIRNGLAAPGGTLTGFASDAPCAPCLDALRTLSDRRDISVTLWHFVEGREEYRRFRNLRSQYVESIFSAVNGEGLNRPYVTNPGVALTSSCLPAPAWEDSE